jgi:hypothetical protein
LEPFEGASVVFDVAGHAPADGLNGARKQGVRRQFVAPAQAVHGCLGQVANDSSGEQCLALEGGHGQARGSDSVGPRLLLQGADRPDRLPCPKQCTVRHAVLQSIILLAIEQMKVPRS